MLQVLCQAFELLRSARDWQKCGRSEYAVPNRELWGNSLSTLRVFKYLVAAKVLTDFEVTSVYRDLPLNECAGGASSSKHLFNSAIDFRIGPEFPKLKIMHLSKIPSLNFVSSGLSMVKA